MHCPQRAQSISLKALFSLTPTVVLGPVPCRSHMFRPCIFSHTCMHLIHLTHLEASRISGRLLSQPYPARRTLSAALGMAQPQKRSRKVHRTLSRRTCRYPSLEISVKPFYGLLDNVGRLYQKSVHCCPSFGLFLFSNVLKSISITKILASISAAPKYAFGVSTSPANRNATIAEKTGSSVKMTPTWDAVVYCWAMG